MSPPRLAFVAFVLLGFLHARALQAVEPSPSAKTEMVVGEMCGGCVKKITARLKQMPEIATIQCDIKTSTVTVVPQANKTIAPRVLWDAMAQIGKTPKKLTGPTGTFTSQPN